MSESVAAADWESDLLGPGVFLFVRIFAISVFLIAVPLGADATEPAGIRAYMREWVRCRAENSCPSPRMTYDVRYGEVGVMGAMHRGWACFPRRHQAFYPPITTIEGREWCDALGWPPKVNPCRPANYIHIQMKQ